MKINVYNTKTLLCKTGVGGGGGELDFFHSQCPIF